MKCNLLTCGKRGIIYITHLETGYKCLPSTRLLCLLGTGETEHVFALDLQQQQQTWNEQRIWQGVFRDCINYAITINLLGVSVTCKISPVKLYIKYIVYCI